MAKYRITIEVEVDTETFDDVSVQLHDATTIALTTLKRKTIEMGPVVKHGQLDTTSSKWESAINSERPMRFKCAKIRQPKKQVLDVGECQDIYYEAMRYTPSVNMLPDERPPKWATDNHASRFEEWLNHHRNQSKRRAKHAEKILSKHCPTKDHLIRFRNYNTSWRYDKIFNARGLDYPLLLQAVVCEMTQQRK